MRSDAEVAAAYDAYAPELFAVAVRTLRDRSRASDLVQETFVKAWRASDRFDPARGSVRSWLHAIHRNVIIDDVRRRAARPALVAVGSRQEHQQANPGPGHDETVVERDMIAQALQLLPDAQRRAIVAVHYHGHSAADVARDLDVPAATVRGWVHRGLHTLRTQLAEGDLDA